MLVSGFREKGPVLGALEVLLSIRRHALGSRKGREYGLLQYLEGTCSVDVVHRTFRCVCAG